MQRWQPLHMETKGFSPTCWCSHRGDLDDFTSYLTTNSVAEKGHQTLWENRGISLVKRVRETLPSSVKSCKDS